MKLVDLGIVLTPGTPQDPEEMRPIFEYLGHDLGTQTTVDYFGCSADVLPPDGLCANTRITLLDHSGTHMDAPWHYAPVMNGDERAKTIDELPLEWCWADCIVLHFHEKPNGYMVTVEDLEAYFKEIDYELKPFDIVLIHTGAEAKLGTPEYQFTGVGFSRESTLWLLNKGVKIVGTDAFTWDVPLKLIAEEYQKTKDPSIIWQAHLAGREKEYYMLEKMCNLGLLPAKGFKIACFPIKIQGGSAGWCRPVAFLPE